MPSPDTDQGRDPLRLAIFLHNQVIGTQASSLSRSFRTTSLTLDHPLSLTFAAVALVALPVFVQAPLVRLAPMLSAMITLPLACAALLLQRRGSVLGSDLGGLLVGFSGSWLAGSLFWGWLRSHPLLHLPVEACLVPLALGGLSGRWRLAASFYLASLAGTAATDAGIALTGLMPLWPRVITASITDAPVLLQEAAQHLLQPANLLWLVALAAMLVWICRTLWQRGDTASRVAAATLAATLGVDGIFAGASLLAPRLSGLV